MAQTGADQRQGGGPDKPLTNLVRAMDDVFSQLNIDGSVFRNPSYKANAAEKVCGLTHTYLKPVRIGRLARIGDAAVYYGRKVDLLPHAYEIVDFDAPMDVAAFIEKRIKSSLIDYMSIHYGNHKLEMDIRDGVIVSFGKIGFDDDFDGLTKGREFTLADLRQIIQNLMHR